MNRSRLNSLKTVLSFILFFFIFSCKNDKKNIFNGNWCIDNINYDVKDVDVGQLDAKEVVVTSLMGEMKPDKIILSDNKIKLMLGDEALIVSPYYKIDVVANKMTIKIDDKKEAFFIKKENGKIIFKVDNAVYSIKKCN